MTGCWLQACNPAVVLAITICQLVANRSTAVGGMHAHSAKLRSCSVRWAAQHLSCSNCYEVWTRSSVVSLLQCISLNWYPCRRWVTYSMEAGAQVSLSFFEFDEQGTLLQRQQHSLPGTSVNIIHDVAVTQHYYVVVEGPIKFDVGRFITQYLTSQCSVAECLVFDEKSRAKIHLIPRLQGKQQAPRVGFCFLWYAGCVMLCAHCMHASGNANCA